MPFLEQNCFGYLEICDGETSIREIAKKAFGERVSAVHEDAVRLSLAELSKTDLIEDGETYTFRSRLSRREMIKRIGTTTAVTLPIVASVVAPTASAAQSSPACSGQVCGTGRCCDGGTLFYRGFAPCCPNTSIDCNNVCCPAPNCFMGIACII